MRETEKKAQEMERLRSRVCAELEQLYQNGVDLFVDNRAVRPEEAVARAVRENSPYMADYVLDSRGALTQVRFDRVTRR